MSKRAWYRCNERKAKALIEQGIKVRHENGVWYYKRRVTKRKKTGSSLPGERPRRGE